MNIYDLVKTEETSYKTRPIPVTDGYEWHMYENINEWVKAKDGQISDKRKGQFDERPVKNIILPILNVNYRTEGFDVKDIQIYVEEEENFHLSFMAKKFHDKWAREQGMDFFIDELVQSYVDFGGSLVKKVKGARPEVIPLQKLAFCDQTDILAGPFAIKHQFSIDQLKEKAGAWDEEKINEVIANARFEKEATQASGQKAKTPGKYIEVYEVHGMFPTAWLTQDTTDYYEEDESNYTRQIHVVTFVYTQDNTERRGVTLFKGKEAQIFKFVKRDERFGTALGRSAIEELIESQVWTNYSMIQIKNMLDKASLLLGVTDDPSFTTKNKITDLEQGEWLVSAPNTKVSPFVFPMSNLNAFENAVQEWEQHARTTGSANEAILGESPTSGTPFKLQNLVTAENESLHVWRRGRIASFLEEIYREWIIPEMVSEMNQGQTFLTELSLDELDEIQQRAVENHINNTIKENILRGNALPAEGIAFLKEQATSDFMKAGVKRFVEIMKDEFDRVPLVVKVNVAGKQKDLNAMTDKLSNIFRTVLTNPMILQDPNAAKTFNKILEYSGLDAMDFKPVSPMKGMMQSPMQPQMQSPMQPLATNQS